MLYMKGQTYIT